MHVHGQGYRFAFEIDFEVQGLSILHGCNRILLLNFDDCFLLEGTLSVFHTGSAGVDRADSQLHSLSLKGLITCELRQRGFVQILAERVEDKLLTLRCGHGRKIEIGCLCKRNEAVEVRPDEVLASRLQLCITGQEVLSTGQRGKS